MHDDIEISDIDFGKNNESPFIPEISKSRNRSLNGLFFILLVSTFILSFLIYYFFFIDRSDKGEAVFIQNEEINFSPIETIESISTDYSTNNIEEVNVLDSKGYYNDDINNANGKENITNENKEFMEQIISKNLSIEKATNKESDTLKNDFLDTSNTLEGPYYIQLGIFSSQENAKKLSEHVSYDKLNININNVKILYRTNKDNAMYIVIIDNYEKDKAYDTCVELVKNKYDCFVKEKR